MDVNATVDTMVENRSAHCKVYVEPSLKKIIQKYAKMNGLTFSEAGRELWLDAIRDKQVQ